MQSSSARPAVSGRSWDSFPANFGGYVSRNGAAGTRGFLLGRKNLLNPSSMLSEERGVRHRQAETSFCKLLKDVLFDATQRGGCACDRVDSQSRSSFSSHTREMCVSPTDSDRDAFHINGVNRNLVCVKDKIPFVSTIYCLHNTGFQFLTNSPSCVVNICGIMVFFKTF